jgi:AcrR family transcriptional regulator
MNCVSKRGRPRGFDRDAVLDKAVQVFWREGYDGATVAELCVATGLNPPSLYAAFGDKARLFEAALDRYQAGVGAFAAAALAEERTAEAAIRRLLSEAADRLATPDQPCGCLVAAGAGSDPVAREAALVRRRLSQAAITARIRQGAAAGELPPNTDVEALARLIVTVVQGMSAQALDGATAPELRAVADGAMRAWPR